MMATVSSRRRTVKLTRRRAPGGVRMLEVEVVARETGLHPELVRRFVRLGLIEPAGGTTEAPLFRSDAPSQLARALRLRRDLGLNYAGAAFAGELLTRIDQLEARLHHYEPRTKR
jgi:hypothetical protein